MSVGYNHCSLDVQIHEIAETAALPPKCRRPIILKDFSIIKHRCPKTPPKMQKRKQQMEEQKRDSTGQNLNPFASAQSKRTFAFSGKTGNSKGECIHFNSFFPHFLYFVSNLFQESRKRGPGSGPRTVKIHQNGPQGRPNRCQKSANLAPRSHQV